MPLLALKTSVLLPEDGQETVVKELSRVVADVIGKPEQYVMVVLEEGTICMSGECVPAAFADVRSIGGLNSETNKRLSEAICSLLKTRLDLDSSHVYVNFSDVAAQNWGWNGGTFG